MKMRLDRWLTTLGAGSRSEVKAWIRGGEAAVNGRIIRDSALSFDTERDVPALRGKTLDGRVMRHVMMYKPADVLTAARDPKQPTVMDLLPDVYRRIGCMPVGRLDKDTTGILIFTCDGEMGHRLLSPSRHVDKIYRALAEGKLGPETAEAFAAGMELSDFTALPARLEIIALDTARAILTEGKYHQVKRMFAARGKPVLELRRVRMGDILLDPELPPGGVRRLTDAEAATLYRAAGL